MIETPADLITLALKKAGVLGLGQTPNAEDTNDSFDELNMMLAQWNRKRWLVYHLIDVAKLSTGAMTYTVGPGMDFDTPRPDKIQSAYIVQQNVGVNPPSFPLEIIESREDYSRITLKNLTAFPNYLFYDSAYPIGVLYPWPIIQQSLYELHIVVKSQLSQFDYLSDQIVLPPEYKAAIVWNLAARLRPNYQMPMDPTVVGLAKDALNTIRSANTQISTLRMPAGLTSGSQYNPFSDQP